MGLESVLHSQKILIMLQPLRWMEHNVTARIKPLARTEKRPERRNESAPGGNVAERSSDQKAACATESPEAGSRLTALGWFQVMVARWHLFQQVNATLTRALQTVLLCNQTGCTQEGEQIGIKRLIGPSRRSLMTPFLASFR